MADVHSKDIRSFNMSRVKSIDTKPEIKIRSFLFLKGLRFRKNDKLLAGTPDIVFKKYRTVIFVNGCFWHGHICSKGRLPKTNIEFWKTKISKNKLRDRNVIKQLRADNWNVIVLWQCELKSEKFDNRLNLLVKQIKQNKTV